MNQITVILMAGITKLNRTTAATSTTFMRMTTMRRRGKMKCLYTRECCKRRPKALASQLFFYFIVAINILIHILEHNPRKRPHTATATAETTRTTKQGRSNGQKNRARRVNVGDFNALTQSVIYNAQRHYRCHIMSVNPYPGRFEEAANAAEAFELSCQIKGVEIEFDRDFRKLVSV